MRARKFLYLSQLIFKGLLALATIYCFFLFFKMEKAKAEVQVQIEKNESATKMFITQDKPLKFQDAGKKKLLEPNQLRAEIFPFMNPELVPEARAEDLVSRLTLEEKISQLMNDAPAIPRLGIPQYNWWNECLHGVAQAGLATVFPQAIGLAATWDTDLMFRVATAIAD